MDEEVGFSFKKNQNFIREFKFYEEVLDYEDIDLFISIFIKDKYSP